MIEQEIFTQLFDFFALKSFTGSKIELSAWQTLVEDAHYWNKHFTWSLGIKIRESRKRHVLLILLEGVLQKLADLALINVSLMFVKSGSFLLIVHAFLVKVCIARAHAACRHYAFVVGFLFLLERYVAEDKPYIFSVDQTIPVEIETKIQRHSLTFRKQDPFSYQGLRRKLLASSAWINPLKSCRQDFLHLLAYKSGQRWYQASWYTQRKLPYRYCASTCFLWVAWSISKPSQRILTRNKAWGEAKRTSSRVPQKDPRWKGVMWYFLSLGQSLL